MTILVGADVVQIIREQQDWVRQRWGLTSAPLCADPRCSISRDPRREEYTICTAVAPEDVLTLRTYGDTRTHYGPASPASAQIPRLTGTNPQVRKLQPAKLRDADKSRVPAGVLHPGSHVLLVAGGKTIRNVYG
jgi:hypothetical protein